MILATNIAETSLTVPGVTAVVDAGWQKVARYDPDRGIDSLELERIPADAADQRAGRAGRMGPGRVRRLWDRPIACGRTASRRFTASICPTPCSTSSRGAAIRRTFEWFDPPAADRVDAAVALLRATRRGARRTVTPLGARMKRLPLHPRLARMLIEVGRQPRRRAGVRAALGASCRRAAAAGHDRERPAVSRRR